MSLLLVGGSWWYLSGLDDYKKIKTADQRQQLEEYRNILYKLDEVQSDLAYFEKPIREVSRIYTNEGGSWWYLLIPRRLSLCKYKDILQADINASMPFLIAYQFNS